MKYFGAALSILILALYGGNNHEAKSTDNEPTTTKRIDLPLIHIGVKTHANGQKDVDVKAPFVRVHNPAGANNAQVKAPFTKVDHSDSSLSKRPIDNIGVKTNTNRQFSTDDNPKNSLK